MTSPSWKDALPAAPPGGELVEAWFTTFDPPDSGILVEHLLPALLATHATPSRDLLQRTMFFGELSADLERLRGRLTVVSSPARKVRDTARYPWLWRYVDHFTVGVQGRAVQHAKLWAFHWRVGAEEHLELHVSSTNLSAPAFKDQLQAGWRSSTPLGARATAATQRTWGELVTFVDALGASAGPDAALRLARLRDLLARAACPEDVAFVASVPGRGRAARPLAALEPTAMFVLTPSIGDWTTRSLAAWSADAGIDPRKVSLAWISTQHPWAQTSGWTLTPAAYECLERSGVQVLSIPDGARLAPLHAQEDPRWSHAKLYLVRSRRKRRLLLTSANWSIAAWGAGSARPTNFELGVLFDTEWSDLESLGQPFDPPDTIPYRVERPEDTDLASTLEWAEARWDGTHVVIRARSSAATPPITAILTFAGDEQAHVTLEAGLASLPWSDHERPPLTARLTQPPDSLEVDVLDLRPHREFLRTPMPEVDPAIAELLREALILQRYGGPAVDADNVAGLASVPPRADGPTGDYSVQVWVEARAAFEVVDRWRAELSEAASDAARAALVRADGLTLRRHYQRRAGPGDALVVDELTWRLGEGD